MVTFYSQYAIQLGDHVVTERDTVKPDHVALALPAIVGAVASPGRGRRPEPRHFDSWRVAAGASGAFSRAHGPTRIPQKPHHGPRLGAPRRVSDTVVPQAKPHAMHVRRNGNYDNCLSHVCGCHRIRHYGLFASANGAESIATARALLNVAPPAADPQEQPDVAPDSPRVLPCPCPRCGARMIVIETFARGCEPSWRPTPIRIDTS